MDSIVYSLEEEEEEDGEEEEEEEAGFNIKSNNPNLKGGEKLFKNSQACAEDLYFWSSFKHRLKVTRQHVDRHSKPDVR